MKSKCFKSSTSLVLSECNYIVSPDIFSHLPFKTLAILNCHYKQQCSFLPLEHCLCYSIYWKCYSSSPFTWQLYLKIYLYIMFPLRHLLRCPADQMSGFYPVFPEYISISCGNTHPNLFYSNGIIFCFF